MPLLTQVLFAILSHIPYRAPMEHPITQQKTPMTRLAAIGGHFEVAADATVKVIEIRNTSGEPIPISQAGLLQVTKGLYREYVKL